MKLAELSECQRKMLDSEHFSPVEVEHNLYDCKEYDISTRVTFPELETIAAQHIGESDEAIETAKKEAEADKIVEWCKKFACPKTLSGG